MGGHHPRWIWRPGPLGPQTSGRRGRPSSSFFECRSAKYLADVRQRIGMARTEDPLSRPEHRKVGAYAFNHAWSLLDRKKRTRAENDEMLHAAYASLYHWGRGGGPLNRSIGEWQVSRVNAVLGLSEPATFHGARALEIARRGHLSPFYLAYGYEALARAASVARDRTGRAKYLREAQRIGRRVKDADDRRMLFEDLATIR